MRVNRKKEFDLFLSENEDKVELLHKLIWEATDIRDRLFKLMEQLEIIAILRRDRK